MFDRDGKVTLVCLLEDGKSCNLASLSNSCPVCVLDHISHTSSSVVVVCNKADGFPLYCLNLVYKVTSIGVPDRRAVLQRRSHHAAVSKIF